MKILIIGKNSSINAALGGLLKSTYYQNLNFVHLGEIFTNEDIENISTATLIITDLTNTNNNSKLFIQQIRELNQKAIIIALHFYQEPEFINPLIEAGASAYLLLNTTSQEIESAIKHAQNDKIFITPHALK